MKRTLVIVALLVAGAMCTSVVLLAAWFRERPVAVTSDEVVGRYKWRNGGQALEIRADGTYTQYVRRADGRSLEHRDHWDLWQHDGYTHINFHDFIDPWPPHVEPTPGTSSYFFVREQRSLHIVIPDVGEYSKTADNASTPR